MGAEIFEFKVDPLLLFEEIVYYYLQYFLTKYFGTGSTFNLNISAPNGVSEKLLYLLEGSAPALFRALPAFEISSILKEVTAV